MSETASLVAKTSAPSDRQIETLDARELPPPQPLQDTLERLTQLDEGELLVQYNDRAPQHLYPQLTDRGYDYETIETDACTVTVIWAE